MSSNIARGDISRAGIINHSLPLLRALLECGFYLKEGLIGNTVNLNVIEHSWVSSGIAGFLIGPQLFVKSWICQKERISSILCKFISILFALGGKIIKLTSSDKRDKATTNIPNVIKHGWVPAGITVIFDSPGIISQIMKLSKWKNPSIFSPNLFHQIFAICAVPSYFIFNWSF